MAENMKPVEPEFRTQKLIDIVNQYDSNAQHSNHLSLKAMKTQELLEKMKGEKDKREFMLLFNVLMISVMVLSIVAIFVDFSVIALVILVLSLSYFVFVRRRLTQETLSLSQVRHDDNNYLKYGFQLKEMRFSSVKLAYMFFFPLLLVMLGFIVFDDSKDYFVTNYLIALALSTLAWFFFFLDDQQVLETIESDLNTLEYLD